MSASPSLTGIGLLDTIASTLPAEEQLALERSIERGYLIVRPEQRDLQRLWTLWCMKKQCPDIRVERNEGYAVVTMHLGPCQTTLSADGMVAISRAFAGCGPQIAHYQTADWCKHPRVPLHACANLAAHLAEIAYLDGVPQQPAAQ
jgi:hypothetical protein